MKYCYILKKQNFTNIQSHLYREYMKPFKKYRYEFMCICKLKMGQYTIYSLYAIYAYTKYTNDFQTGITQCII